LLKKNAEISFSPLPSVKCSPDSLAIVFYHLLDNSLKFQQQNNRPIIKIEASDKGREYEFSIKDNGIGIGSDYHDKIFIILNRGEIRDEYEGRGKGLAIAKKIISQHDGNIWLHNSDKNGSEFRLTLPK
jgi:light-regulated signal transduction histidine kinase (bacteriophytochrome)